MRILWVGDPHLHMGNLEVSKQFLSKLETITNEQKPDFVLLAGDLFHTHSIVRAEILNLWINYLEVAKFPHIALVGNHDQVAPGSSVHALVALKKYAKVVDGPYKMGKMFFVPYVHTAQEFAEMLGQAGDARVLFCHQTFDGAQYENGFYAPDGFPLTLVSGFDRVISGHIHKRQGVGGVFYPGTPFQHSFNDAGEKKAIYLLEVEIGTTTAIKQTAIELDLPEFHIWRETPESVIPALRAVLDDEILRQSSFKVVLQGTKAHVMAVQDSKEFKEIKKSLKVTLCPEYTDVTLRDEKISDSIAPEQMLGIYIKDVMKTELDRGRLLDMSARLLRGETV